MRLRRLEVPVARLPEELDGLRVLHLSDFHLGIPSRGAVAVRRAVAWAEELAPDLVAVTGDLVSHPRGAAKLFELMPRLGPCYAVLGNHDVEYARDPFSRAADLRDLSPARLLRDEAALMDVNGRSIQIVGVDPRTYRLGTSRPWNLAAEEADLRILLCHFPSVVRRLPLDTFDLVLAGHMHDGQISLPLPKDKLRLAHPRARFTAGLYERGGTCMHVSPGLGTTFVPFRFYARPEATELLLKAQMPPKRGASPRLAQDRHAG